MILTSMPDVTVAAGMAISLSPAGSQAVPLPVAYYAQTDTNGSEPAASGPTRPPLQISQAQIQDELDSALQKSGLRTEIENEKSGLMIVRFVEFDTGAVVMQFPTQTAIDLVASLTKSTGEGFPALAGHLVDQSA